MDTEPVAEPAAAIGQEQLHQALKRSCAALKSDGIPFGLAGGYALWVHGAPEPEHDVDLVVAEPDVEAAARCLQEDGFRVERPPEDWLFKAYLDRAMVDVLHRLNGVPVTAELVQSAHEEEVLGLRIPVLPAEQVVVNRLLAMSERYCDFAALLAVVRAVREQLDWQRIERQTSKNDFASAFLYLVRRLGIRS